MVHTNNAKKSYVEMTDEELRAMIASNCKLAEAKAIEFKRYLSGLAPRDRLILEAIASERGAKVFSHSRLDHELYVSLHGASPVPSTAVAKPETAVEMID